LGKLWALVLILSFYAAASVRPSFYLDACAWNATEILVLRPTAQPGTFTVIETIKGELAPGATLQLPGLTPAQGITAKLSQLSAGNLNHPFEDVPPISESDRVIVFLRRPGASLDFAPGSNLPVPSKSEGWQPANFMGDLRTSVVWIQDSVSYGFLQTMNPGPTHFVRLGVSEEGLRQDIESVLQLRNAMDQAMATADPVGRSRQLGALVRSGNGIARMSALRKLEHGGDPEVDVLLGMLVDQSLLGWHQEIVGALLSSRVADLSFRAFLVEETNYWSKACGTLNPGWWNSTDNPDVETSQDHYTRAYALLKAVRERNLPAALPDVRDFAAVWSTCPPSDEDEKSDQIADELKLLLGVDAR
jgi:hypothetical protein